MKNKSVIIGLISFLLFIIIGLVGYIVYGGVNAEKNLDSSNKNMTTNRKTVEHTIKLVENKELKNSVDY